MTCVQGTVGLRYGWNVRFKVGQSQRYSAGEINRAGGGGPGDAAELELLHPCPAPPPPTAPRQGLAAKQASPAGSWLVAGGGGQPGGGRRDPAKVVRPSGEPRAVSGNLTHSPSL